MDYTIFIDLILDFVTNKVCKAVKKKQWKELFTKTGDFLLNSPDTEKDFAKDLELVFSKETMEELAKEMGDGSSVGFQKCLHNKLKGLFHKYELDDQADVYISFFVRKIMNYLAENDTHRYLTAFLNEWEERNTKQLDRIEEKENEIIKQLQRKEVTGIYTLEDVENEIKKYSRYPIDLSFFDWDDDQFAIELKQVINQDEGIVCIEGKSREETLYRVLNYIKTNFSGKDVYIIKDEKSWNEMHDVGYEHKILIPFFYTNDLFALPGNINILIYNEEEPSRRKEKIVLRRRTKHNLIDALKKIGIDYTEANKMFEKTHGIYAPLKRILFYTETMHIPAWATHESKPILAALLCGKWTDNEGDKQVIEELSGMTYEECITDLRKYQNGEEPFVIISEVANKTIYQIASIEEAWVLLRRYIYDELKEKFIKVFCEILKKLDPMPRKYMDCFVMEGEENTYNWTRAIKSGMIRSFILWTCINAEKEDQIAIDRAVGDILNSIDNKEKWSYISNYIVDLCEASPESVLFRLEKELSSPSGLEELFRENTQYTSFLWAIEQLVQQSKYVSLAIKWLWEMDDKNISYKITNSPRSILQVVFCAWYNVSALNKDDKIREAEKAIHKYNNAWDIIASNLPEFRPAIMSSLSQPTYKDIEVYDEAAKRNDAYDVYRKYLYLCIEKIGTNVQRWIMILDKLTYYQIEDISINLDTMIQVASDMNDRDKTLIKEELRKIVHQHRYFRDAEWARKENIIELYERAIDRIIVNNPVYDYLYLFIPYYDFPLLHPVQYKQDDISETHDINDEMIEDERKRKIDEFKTEDYSIYQLIEYGMEREKPGEIGRVIAKHYDKGNFNKSIFKCFVKQKQNKTQAIDYIRCTLKEKDDIKVIVDYANEIKTDIEILADIISLQIVDNVDDAIIFNAEDEMKSVYWKRESGINISKEASSEVVEKALVECYKWGCLGTYIEMLFEYKEKISQDELFQAFLHMPNIKNIDRVSNAKWCFEKILELLQKRYINDDDKCFQIAQIEWWAGGLIDWNQMLCTERLIKKDPRVYAGLVNIVCRKDSGKTDDPEKRKLANKLYGRFRDIHFCPAERDGKVKYEDIKKWIDEFVAILQTQQQSSIWDTIIGELLPYSPVDEDGFMPCKAVRQIIEEYYTEKLARSYATTVFNMRGIYSPNGGRGEEALACKYEENAKHLEKESPNTARIYRDLSNEYRAMAAQERKIAEDVW